MTSTPTSGTNTNLVNSNKSTITNIQTLSLPDNTTFYQLTLPISTPLEHLEITSNSKIQEVWGLDYLGTSSLVQVDTQSSQVWYSTELVIDPTYTKEVSIKVLFSLCIYLIASCIIRYG